ncbi:MAG: phosphoribosylglycinamide formyltransferase [Phycisphaerales bacterium]|nr:phosphoribosylglycinamide formyltransferase [Phycisphaerales bacterium]
MIVARGTILISLPKKLRLGILLSGSGRTFQNLHDRSAAGSLSATIACVIGSRPDAFGLERARRVGVPAIVVDRRTAPDDEFHERIAQNLIDASIDLVCMAGFNCLWRVPPAFTGRVLNIHPALLPEFGGPGFYGTRVHRAVLAAGRRESGCTVHFCDNEYDHGPILVQRRIPVMPDDTPDALAARVFEQECIAYPDAINLIAEGRVRVDAGRVTILPPSA